MRWPEKFLPRRVGAQGIPLCQREPFYFSGEGSDGTGLHTGRTKRRDNLYTYIARARKYFVYVYARTRADKTLRPGTGRERGYGGRKGRDVNERASG